MASEQDLKKMISVLSRIADALETIAGAVDEEEEELNVFVRSDTDDD